ncbi:chymotrypsin-2 isoform X1 [Solenopsis invicta]|uniref:chymotrypsin-2 isoform X1 n=1 Tax=Solenopsis invicta TaxID=13686 RepID=UPI00059613E1|nr:chymotrypsin-2 isoform X1 [Solenopsis invicta]
MIIQLLLLVSLSVIGHGTSTLQDYNTTLQHLEPMIAIVVGRLAKLGEIPYQVSLQRIKTQHHFCGESIINRIYVLTAAHCIKTKDIKDISVNVGLIDLRKPHAVHLIKSSYIHQKYNRTNSWIHDIALLKLKTPLVFSFLVRPVTLPKQNQIIRAGSHAVVSGFGRLSFRGKRTNNLYITDILITKQTTCQEIYNLTNRQIYSTQICANDPTKLKGFCHGDSGGPLVVNGQLVGIVSWLYRGCGNPKYPQIYTHVPSYVDWINEHSII